MVRLPPRSTRTDTRFPYPTLFRSRLFSGILKIAGRCNACGLDLRKQDAGDGPAVFVIFFLGALFMPLVFWVEFGFEPPWWVHILLWPLPVLIVALAILHPMKGLLVAQQLRPHASERGTVDYSPPEPRRALCR